MKNEVDAAGIGTDRYKVRSKQWRRVIMLAFLWSLTLSTRFDLMQAATIQAKSASLGDVRAAVQSARDGDTVTVPAATETWTTPLEITKNITLQGAGPGLTVIIDAVPEAARSEGGSKQPSQGALSGLHHSSPANGRSWAPRIGARRPNPLIFINLARDLPFRLTGFTFKGASN